MQQNMSLMFVFASFAILYISIDDMIIYMTYHFSVFLPNENSGNNRNPFWALSAKIRPLVLNSLLGVVLVYLKHFCTFGCSKEEICCLLPSREIKSFRNYNMAKGVRRLAYSIVSRDKMSTPSGHTGATTDISTSRHWEHVTSL